VFPPSHMELLPVREAKKEQAEYEAQMKKEAKWAEPEEKDEGLKHLRVEPDTSAKCPFLNRLPVDFRRTHLRAWLKQPASATVCRQPPQNCTTRPHLE